MPDLKLGADSHDLIIENNDFKLTQVESESLQQRLKIKLLTFQGEYYLNTQLGVPWFQRILTKQISKETVDNLLKIQILNEPEVQALVEFRSSIDKLNRIYSLNFTVRSSNGNENIPIELQL